MKDEQGAADRHGRLFAWHEASMAVPPFLLGQDVEAREADDTVTHEVRSEEFRMMMLTA